MSNSEWQREDAQGRAREGSAAGPTNRDIADMLEQIANLLEAQDANPHRVRAYRNGAATVRSTEASVAEMVRSGNVAALKELPNIGTGLVSVIGDYVNTGQSGVLTEAQSKTSPEDVIAQVPVVGEKLAHRVVEQLHIASLEELEQAAHDGRLAQVEGFGPKRVESVRVYLAGLLSGAAQRHSQRVQSNATARTDTEAAPGAAPSAAQDRPDVKLLLEIDAEYRRKAEAGELKTIAPKRMNPNGEAWLPVMRVKRGGWSFTVLFSNTARAHQSGMTHDWAVVYFERGGQERQCTVVTATSGPLKGKRIVRGREVESRRVYDEGPALSPPKGRKTASRRSTTQDERHSRH